MSDVEAGVTGNIDNLFFRDRVLLYSQGGLDLPCSPRAGLHSLTSHQMLDYRLTPPQSAQIPVLVSAEQQPRRSFTFVFPMQKGSLRVYMSTSPHPTLAKWVTGRDSGDHSLGEDLRSLPRVLVLTGSPMPPHVPGTFSPEAWPTRPASTESPIPLFYTVTEQRGQTRACSGAASLRDSTALWSAATLPVCETTSKSDRRSRSLLSHCTDLLVP